MHYTGMAGFGRRHRPMGPGARPVSVIASIAFGMLALHLTRFPNWTGSLWRRRRLSSPSAACISPPWARSPSCPIRWSRCRWARSQQHHGVLHRRGGGAYARHRRFRLFRRQERSWRGADPAPAACQCGDRRPHHRQGQPHRRRQYLFEELTGYRRDKITARGLFDEILHRRWRHANGSLRTEGMLRGKDGRQIPVELLSKPDECCRERGSIRCAISPRRGRRKGASTISPISIRSPACPTATPSSTASRPKIARRRTTTGASRSSFRPRPFKETNDMFGHAAGDAVLAEIAKRLRQLKARNAARFGGDEFFAIFPAGNARSRSWPSPIASLPPCATVERRRQPTVRRGERRHRLFPDEGLTGAELMANADLAMYRAKERRAARRASSNWGWTCEVRERRSLARDLRQALGARRVRTLLPAAIAAHRQPDHRL